MMGDQNTMPMPRIDPSLFASGIRFACQGCGACCLTRGRYGFVYVDQDESMKGSLNRTKKDSYFWYKEVIENNGKDL